MPIVNVRDFGAAGDGATDDTAALQEAIDAFSGRLAVGGVHLPVGVYRTTAPLVYRGTYSTSIRISGEASASGEGMGAVIQYRGPKGAGSAVLEVAGGSDVIVERLTLDVGPGAGRAQYGLYIHDDPTRKSAGVNHLTVDHVVVSGRGTESGTACVSVGVGFDRTVDNTDCNDIQFVSCKFVGCEKGIVTASGNVKNIFMSRCGFWWSEIGVDCGFGGSGAGVWSIRDCNFLWNATSDVRMGAGLLAIDSCQSEGSGMLLANYGVTPNPANARVTGCNWESKTVGDDTFIKFQGSLYLQGNQFANNRTGRSLPAIRLDWNATAPTTLESRQNYYQGAAADYSDGRGGALLLEGHGFPALAAPDVRPSIRTWGDYGGTPGRLVKLRSY